MKFFPTQIDTFRNCPRKYFYNRDPEIRAKYSKSSPHLVLGNAVHDALQYFFDVSKVPVGERTYERLCDLLRDAWAGRNLFRRNRFKQEEARKQAFDGDRAVEKSWGEKGMNILYRFFQTADVTTVPLTTEQFHELRLTDRVTLGGKIDRIDRMPDGGLVVMDYKTGKPPRVRGATEIVGGSTATYRRLDHPDMAANDLQLAHYALLVSRKFRGKVVRCSYLYLNDDLDVGYTPDEDMLERKRVEILEMCERILAEQDFEPTPNPLCPWCDYRELCPKGDEWEKSRTPVVTQTEIPF